MIAELDAIFYPLLIDLSRYHDHYCIVHCTAALMQYEILLVSCGIVWNSYSSFSKFVFGFVYEVLIGSCRRSSFLELYVPLSLKRDWDFSSSLQSFREAIFENYPDTLSLSGIFVEIVFKSLRFDAIVQRTLLADYRTMQYFTSA